MSSNDVWKDEESADGKKAWSYKSNPRAPPMRGRSGLTLRTEFIPTVNGSASTVAASSNRSSESCSFSESANSTRPRVVYVSALRIGLGPAIMPPMQHAKPPGQRSTSLQCRRQRKSVSHHIKLWGTYWSVS